MPSYLEGGAKVQFTRDTRLRLAAADAAASEKYANLDQVFTVRNVSGSCPDVILEETGDRWNRNAVEAIDRKLRSATLKLTETRAVLSNLRSSAALLEEARETLFSANATADSSFVLRPVPVAQDISSAIRLFQNPLAAEIQIWDEACFDAVEEWLRVKRAFEAKWPEYAEVSPK